MTRKLTLLLTCFSLFSFSPAMAQTAAPGAVKNMPAATTKAAPVRTAKSLDCSKQADAKKMHGPDRRKFMDKCKRS